MGIDLQQLRGPLSSSSPLLFSKIICEQLFCCSPRGEKKSHLCLDVSRLFLCSSPLLWMQSVGWIVHRLMLCWCPQDKGSFVRVHESNQVTFLPLFINLVDFFLSLSSFSCCKLQQVLLLSIDKWRAKERFNRNLTRRRSEGTIELNVIS